MKDQDSDDIMESHSFSNTSDEKNDQDAADEEEIRQLNQIPEFVEDDKSDETSSLHTESDITLNDDEDVAVKTQSQFSVVENSNVVTQSKFSIVDGQSQSNNNDQQPISTNNDNMNDDRSKYHHSAQFVSNNRRIEPSQLDDDEEDQLDADAQQQYDIYLSESLIDSVNPQTMRDPQPSGEIVQGIN